MASSIVSTVSVLFCFKFLPRITVLQP